MFFDELGHDYTTEAIGRALKIASEIEASSNDTLHSCGEALSRRGDTELAPDRDVGQLVIVDGLVCQLWLGDERSVARWGGVALGPMMEFRDRGVFPPPVSAFPETVCSYIDARAAATTRADARARYYDFLWLRRKSFSDARAAHAMYVTAGAGANPADATEVMLAADYLARAAQLSMSLNLDRRVTAQAILVEMARVLPSDATGFVWRLARSSARLLASAPQEATAFVGAAVLEAEVSAAKDRHRERSLYETVEFIAAELGDQPTAQAVRRAIAESWEAEANHPDHAGMSELALLDEAIRAHQRIGDGPAVQRLKNRVAETAARVAADLPSHRFEFSVPTEQFDHDVDALRAHLSEKDRPFLRLTRLLGVLQRWDQVRADFDEARAKAPLQWLVSRVHVEPDGRVSLPPEGDTDREEAYILDNFTMNQQLRAMYSLELIVRVRETGEWSGDAIVSAIRDVNPMMAAACDSGIRAFEAGDYWTACHVLTPQVERGFRELASKTSANIRRLVIDQGIEVASLNAILEDEQFVRFLGSDMTRCLTALFTDSRGLNVRNNVAHGLLDPATNHWTQAFIALMGVLTATWIEALFQDHQAGSLPE